jgi:hypothetical protein
MTADKELTQMPVLEAWLRLCCESDEFVANYNRLRGTNIRFTLPKRSGIELLVDQATGHVPTLENDEAEIAGFMEFCRDTLLRLPMLQDPRNFQAAR